MSEDLLDDQHSRALDAFSSPDTELLARREALSRLIASKVLPKHADHPAVIAGRDLLLQLALSSSEPVYRLAAISESIRLGQVVKRWSEEITRTLRPSFQNPIPDFQLLSEADDRLNLARACSRMDEEWLPEYLAKSIAEENTAEKARLELVRALMERSASLAILMEKLGNAFRVSRPATQNPAETIAKRLSKTLESVREVILESEIEAGDDLGTALYNSISSSFFESGKPSEERAVLDLTRAGLSLLHDIVRTRLSTVADPNTYRIVGYFHRLGKSTTWHEDLKAPVDRLIQDVREALLLLGRQGRRDQLLYKQLEVLCVFPDRARIIARKLAERHPDLPEDVREWLESGRVRQRVASETAQDVAAGTTDEIIGLALATARVSERPRKKLEEAKMIDLEIYDPELANLVRYLLEASRKLSTHVEQAAALRSLDLFGNTGEEVPASTKYFRIIGDNPRQHMRVREPAIVRRRADGTIGEVITQGVLE